MAWKISAKFWSRKQPLFRKKKSFLKLTIFFYLMKWPCSEKCNHIFWKHVKIKVMLAWALFLILLISAGILRLNFLHGKQAVQYLLNYKIYRFYRLHFGRVVKTSTREGKSCNPPTARVIFTAWIFRLFYLYSPTISLWLYNFINVLYHIIGTCDVIYLRIVTYAQPASF